LICEFWDTLYIHSSHTQKYDWGDENNRSLKGPISKGKRLIIVQAGGEVSFVQDALLIVKSGMNANKYFSPYRLEM
jgi:hypothetical protein